MEGQRCGPLLVLEPVCPRGLTACSFFLAALANSDRSRLWIEGDGNRQT